MKKIAAFCIALIMITALSLVFFDTVQGQGFNAFQQTTFTTVTVGQTLVENTVIGFNQLSWTISGTVATCTVSLDSSPDGSTWTVGGVIAGQTCTSNGNSSVTAGSANFMRVNMQAISGAGATVVVTYKGWVVNPSGGGGLPAGLTFVAPTLTVSTAGSGNGSVALSGNTSGTSSLTTNATATQITAGGNLVASPLFIAATDPANPQFVSAGQTTTGLRVESGNAQWILYGAGNAEFSNGRNGNPCGSANSACVGLGSTYAFAWSSAAGGLSAANSDVGISRIGAATLSIGNGSAGDESGVFRPGTSSCRVTADITLPVNTPTTVCSWTLPAIAKAWAWQCQIPWVISAGTGTNTLAIIANPSQTPTGATNGAAEIKTTNTNTATEQVTAISASGATTLLTSGTITPSATVFMSSTSGTLLASATAGTFTIQMTAAGTTATAAAKAGSTCILY